MVIRVINGFEAGVVPPSITLTGSGTLTCTTTTPANGAYSLVLTGAPTSNTVFGMGSFTAASSTDDYWCGFNYRREFNSSSGYCMWSMEVGAASYINFVLTNAGSIEIRRDNSVATTVGTVLHTIPTGVIGVSTWHFVAIRVRPHDTTGQIDLSIDGASLATLTGVDTLGNTASTNRSFSFAIQLGSGNIVRFDDFACGDSTGSAMTGLPAPHKIEALRPTSDVVAGFTRSAGAANFETVDEVPVSSADHVSSNVATTRDEYGLGDRTHSGAVLGLAIKAAARNSDSGGASLKIGVKRAGTEAQSTVFGLSTSVSHVSYVSQVDPITGVAYTTANVNALTATLEVA